MLGPEEKDNPLFGVYIKPKFNDADSAVLLQWVTPILTIANSKRNSRKKKLDDIF